MTAPRLLYCRQTNSYYVKVRGGKTATWTTLSTEDYVVVERDAKGRLLGVGLHLKPDVRRK